MNKNEHCKLLKDVVEKELLATGDGKKCNGMAARPYSKNIAFNCRHCDLLKIRKEKYEYRAKTN